MSIFEKCNKIQPNTVGVLFNLALVFQSTGKIEKAKDIYLNLISINPKDIRSYYGLHLLDIVHVETNFHNKLQELNNDENILISEKSLINFILSKIEIKNKNIKNELKYLEKSHLQCLEANKLIYNQSNFYYKKIISNHFDNIIFKKILI